MEEIIKKYKECQSDDVACFLSKLSETEKFKLLAYLLILKYSPKENYKIERK